MKKIRHCNRIVQAFEHLLFHCVLMSALVRSKICGECVNQNTCVEVDVVNPYSNNSSQLQQTDERSTRGVEIKGLMCTGKILRRFFPP